jgi:hypothetical protein
MNRRILISENERSRILGLHENRRMKEWGLINEQVEGSLSAELKAKNIKITGSIQAPDNSEWSLIDGSKITAGYYGFVVNNAEQSTTYYMDNGMTLKAEKINVTPTDMPLIKLPNWTDQPIAGAKTVLVGAGTTTDNAKTTTDNAKFIPTGYDTIEACKAEAPINVSSKVFAGQPWNVVKGKWIDSKCNGTTPCIAGNVTSNINLRKAICEGTFTMGGPAAATPSEYTVYKGGVPSKMTVDQISQGLADGTIKPTDKVWDTTKGQGSDAIVPLSTLTSDTKIQASIKTIAPELAGVEKTYKISVDGRVAAIEYTKETLTKAITDGILNKASAQIVIVDPITKQPKYQSVMTDASSEVAQIFNSLSTPESVTPERKSTNIPELDAWLKGPIGSAWDKLTDLKQKESMFDSFEKTDPIITKLKDTVGKGPLRSALGMAADTGVGRGLQRLRGKLGAAITGNQPVA